MNRRDLFKSGAFAAAGITLNQFLGPQRVIGDDLKGPALAGPKTKRLEGVFPIGFSPFTEDDKLDLDGLASQVKFCNRGRVHGLVWPQLASSWSTLNDRERMDGTETIVSSGKGGSTALVIGVQAPEMANVLKYAKQAEKLGADAVISLPPAGVNDPAALLDYYRQIGLATELPLFVQSTGTMSVDLLVDMYNAIPTFRHVKDEAGNPLTRVTEIRKRTSEQLQVFSGNGVGTMISEMELGFSGHCPYTNLADVYAAAFDLFHAGKKREAFDMFGRIQAFSSITPTNTIDIMIARGVFKPTTRTRKAPPVPGSGGGPGGGGRPAPRQLTQDQIRQELQTYLGLYLNS